MKKSKVNHDIISEQEFTIRGNDGSTDPQEDSPGDSETDSGVEFSAGVNYQPNDEDSIDDIEGNDDSEQSRNKNAAIERPSHLVMTPLESKFRIPKSAMIQDSELPSPRKEEKQDA